jgi:hypothetical protein
MRRHHDLDLSPMGFLEFRVDYPGYQRLLPAQWTTEGEKSRKRVKIQTKVQQRQPFPFLVTFGFTSDLVF